MTSTPQVSIGMPVYNGERFIREAIDSLLAQTFIDFELIISDNASTDLTEEICRGYAARDTRVIYWRQSENRGALNNFLFVLHKATGKYFMWAASDDYWSNNWLSLLINNFRVGTAIAFGHVIAVDENSSIIKSYPFFHFSRFKFIRLLQLFLDEENSHKANYIYGLYNRTNLLKFQFHDTYGSDNHFVFEVVQDGLLLTNANALIFKRNVLSSEGNKARQAYSSKYRKLFLLDYLPYYWAHLKIAKGKILKLALLMLLPVKYIKSIVLMWWPIVLNKIANLSTTNFNKN
jgi:glycosyltransferase involved in cell wall biosynthesis